MNHWTLENTSLQSVQKLIDGVLSKMDVPPFAQVVWESDILCVRIDKGGKSEFRLVFEPHGNGLKIAEGKRNVSLLHKPFVGVVEKFVDQVLRQAGARQA